jgi:hypothetical protein
MRHAVKKRTFPGATSRASARPLDAPSGTKSRCPRSARLDALGLHSAYAGVVAMHDATPKGRRQPRGRRGGEMSLFGVWGALQPSSHIRGPRGGRHVPIRPVFGGASGVPLDAPARCRNPRIQADPTEGHGAISIWGYATARRLFSSPTVEPKGVGRGRPIRQRHRVGPCFRHCAIGRGGAARC